MSQIESDALIAATGTNTALSLRGKGTGKVSLGDANLLWPDADGSSSGDVLQTNASGVLSFATPAGGGAWTFINKTTVAAASLFTITGFTSTYDHHVLVIPGCQAGDSIYQIQLSTDGGTSYETGSNYAYTVQGNAANSGTFSTERSTGTTQWEIGRGVSGVHPLAYSAEIHLFGMAQTVYNTTYQGLWSGQLATAIIKGGPMLGCMLTTGAWNALKIFNTTYTGDVYLYGVSQS